MRSPSSPFPISGNRAPNPLPKAARLAIIPLSILEDLLGQFNVALRPPGLGIVEDARFPKAGRLAQLDISRDDGRKDPPLEVGSHLIGHLLGEIVSQIVHG